MYKIIGLQTSRGVRWVTGEFKRIVTKWPVKYDWTVSEFADVLNYAQTTASPTQLKPCEIKVEASEPNLFQDKTIFNVSDFTDPDSPFVTYTGTVLAWLEENVNLTSYEEKSYRRPIQRTAQSRN